jgi:lysozyme
MVPGAGRFLVKRTTIARGGPMNDSEAETRIAEYEGKREYMYHDSKGIPTIGIGFNLERGGAASSIAEVGADYDELMKGEPTSDEAATMSEEEQARRRLTEDQIRQLFLKDLANAVSDAESALGGAFSELEDPRQFVVVDMIFNLGIGGFGHFHKAIAAIEAENWEEAGAQMKDSHWYSQVGPRAEKDVQMMISGDWA